MQVTENRGQECSCPHSRILESGLVFSAARFFRMKFNVTFRCTLPVDFDKHPAGEELAEFLAANLREQGLNIHVADNYEDFAWLLEFKESSPTPWILVGHVGEDVYEWLVQITSGVTWLGRLFGRSDKELREKVAEKLHSTIDSHSSFSDIRWHQGDFANAGWTPGPTE